MEELRVAALTENLDCVTEFVHGELDALRCPEKIRRQIDVAVDELFANIACYAYGFREGWVTVRVERGPTPVDVSITFIDEGVPYNPLRQADPDVRLPLEKRSVGGLGIFLVKRTMDEVLYRYQDGRNMLRITRRLFRPTGGNTP